MRGSVQPDSIFMLRPSALPLPAEHEDRILNVRRRKGRKDMPHTTYAYPFEAKVGHFAGELSERFSANSLLRSFLLTLDPAGNVLSLVFEDGSADWHERPGQLKLLGTSHLFYDPLEDGMEYIWLSWHGVDQPVMERLTGQRFIAADFQSHPDFEYRAGCLPTATDRLPSSWGVMF